MAPVKSLSLPGEVLQGWTAGAETTLDREYRNLEKALASAAKSLEASIDFRLPSPRR